MAQQQKKLTPTVAEMSKRLSEYKAQRQRYNQEVCAWRKDVAELSTYTKWIVKFVLLLTIYRLSGSDKAIYVQTWFFDLFRVDPERDVDAKKLSFADWMIFLAVCVGVSIGVEGIWRLASATRGGRD